MTDDPRAAEYEDEFEHPPPRNVVVGVIVFLIGVVVALVVGTVLVVLAQYPASWLGVSEVALVVSYVGLIAIGALLFVGSDIRQELEYLRLFMEREQLDRVLADLTEAVDAVDALEEGDGAENVRRRVRRSRRPRMKRR
jgi:hypothetical protein